VRIVRFVILTMFVAIIDESFSGVREDLQQAKEERAEQKNNAAEEEQLGGDMNVNIIRRNMTWFMNSKRVCRCLHINRADATVSPA
jgi:hypothetical protein